MALISAWMVRKQFSSHVAARGLRPVDQAADVEAVRHAGGRAVVAGGEDVAVAHDHRADLGAQAGRALRHLARDGHEVLVPARSVARHLPPSVAVDLTAVDRPCRGAAGAEIGMPLALEGGRGVGFDESTGSGMNVRTKITQRQPRRRQHARGDRAACLDRAGADDAGRGREAAPPTPASPPPRRPRPSTTGRRRAARDPAVPARAERGVDDVTAVELPDRQQVERGHQQTHPAGQRDRVEDDGDCRS